MKTIPTLFILSALATSFTLNAMPPEGRGGPPSRAEFIKRFDLDADGKLSKEERENARQAVKGEGTRPRGKRGQMRRVLIEEFDKDGDGKLTKMERKKAGKAMRERMALKHFDRDGDGQLSDAERQQARVFHKARQAKLLEKFDSDGDGKLSAMERKAVRQWRQETGKRPFSDGPPPPDGSENL